MIDRRRFLGGSLAVLLAPAVLARAAHHEEDEGLPSEARELLGKSGFVYVSPLRSDGSESTCHGEVWYGWLDGAVVLITSSEAWKARALGRGLDRARIWVGDHGRWKQTLGLTRNEAFREAPSFVARASAVKDDALLDRLLALYDEKYPKEIASWRDRMRSGYRDGSRTLIRYVPAATS